jgi:hypothetical protein
LYPKPHRHPGYYLEDEDSPGVFNQVEFSQEEAWHCLTYRPADNSYWASETDHIRLKKEETGYWYIDQSQHPDYEPPTQAAHEYRERSSTLGSEDKPSTQRALLLKTSSSGDSDVPPTHKDKGKKVQWGDTPDTPDAPEASSSTARFNYSGRIITDQDEEQQQLDENILAADLGYRLDIQNREPDDPQYPDRASYQLQIVGSVIKGSSTTSLTTTCRTRTHTTVSTYPRSCRTKPCTTISTRTTSSTTTSTASSITTTRTATCTSSTSRSYGSSNRKIQWK